MAGRPRKVVEEPAVTSDGIQFFGDCDINKDNKISAQYPAWYHELHIEELKESIGRKERALDNRMIKEDMIMRTKNELDAEKKKLKSIVDSKPELSDSQRDKCYSAYVELSKQIAETMPTRRDARNGFVSPQQERNRLDKNHIKISPDVARACGIKNIEGDKISGKAADKCFKILGRMLGEPTNVETLRRDGSSEAYRTVNDHTMAILNALRDGKK
jgi:hypothetical protein